MDESASEKALTQDKGEVPPTSPPPMPMAPPVEFVVQTHMRMAIFATVMMFPIGVFAMG